MTTDDEDSGLSPDEQLFGRRDPAMLAAERERLSIIAGLPWWRRLGAYLRLSGPGFLQSAFSLGGGSLSASLMAGALLGYALLWVQPVAMACGVVMLMAMAYQAIHTDERPLQAVNRHVHPVMGWGWAISALIASLIWVLPQYNLSVDVIADMTGTTLAGPITLVPSLAILIVVIAITWNYGGRGTRGVRLFETITRLLIALIVLSFALVVALSGLRLGIGEFISGMFGFHIPQPGGAYPAWQEAADHYVRGQGATGTASTGAELIAQGAGRKGFDLLLAAFAAAVGINMTFLFPYSIKARGWGPAHNGLAKVDLWAGMLIPFALTTSLLMIAAGNQFYGQLDFAGILAGEKPDAAMLARSLEPVAGPIVAHVIFGVGVLGMTISSIAMMMLVSGFVVSELTGKPVGSLQHRIGLLLPAIGVIGPLIWREWAFYIAVPTSIVCLLFLPIAYISVVVLQNRRSFLGEALPRGRRRLAWNLALGTSLTIVLIAVGRAIWLKAPALLEVLGLQSG